MIAWTVAGCVCLAVVIAAIVVVVRVLSFASESDSTEAQSFDSLDNDADDWAWRAPSDAR